MEQIYQGKNNTDLRVKVSIDDGGPVVQVKKVDDGATYWVMRFELEKFYTKVTA